MANAKKNGPIYTISIHKGEKDRKYKSIGEIFGAACKIADLYENRIGERLYWDNEYQVRGMFLQAAAILDWSATMEWSTKSDGLDRRPDLWVKSGKSEITAEVKQAKKSIGPYRNAGHGKWEKGLEQVANLDVSGEKAVFYVIAMYGQENSLETNKDVLGAESKRKKWLNNICGIFAEQFNVDSKPEFIAGYLASSNVIKNILGDENEVFLGFIFCARYV